LGLIGGSIALEVRSKGLAKRVVGYNRSAKGRRIALKRKACHQVYSRPELAVTESDLVILATPVRTVSGIARDISASLAAGAIVTDVGSTKENIVRRLERLLPKHVSFIGGHPIAGTEKSGMASACLSLFKNRWWLVTPRPPSVRNSLALSKLEKFIKALGAKPARMTPRDHDWALAVISHLPHMAAYALVDTALKVKNGRSLRFAAGGFRDFTRIAASSPQMWAEICLDNKEAILATLGRFEKSLAEIKKRISKQDGRGLEKFFAKTAQVRRKL
jgi:cyclohexadieny/prephenate dehydrogenase